MKRFFRSWFHQSPKIFIDFFTFIGFLWTIISIANYMLSEENKIKSNFIICVLLIGLFIVSLIKNKPKKSFKYKLRDKDNFIEVKVGDAFKNKGALVVPINNYFDTSLSGNVSKNSNSIQFQLVQNLYNGNYDKFKEDISNKGIKKSKEYEIGTVIEIEKNDKKIYLLANSKIDNNNRANSNKEDILTSLYKLWNNISNNSGVDNTVIIPLINTRNARSGIPKINVIQIIIDSYIKSAQTLVMPNKLIISIYPKNLEEDNINLKEIEGYLKFTSQYYLPSNS